MSESPATVFLVDDDAALRHALGQLLESAGLRVEPFADGPAFLAAYAEQRPGCLLLDVAMPGMSGLEVQAELRRRGLGIPIVFLTGHADVPMAVKAVQGGAVDFLEKPFHADVLVQRLRRALTLDEERRRNDEHARTIRQRHAQLTSREKEVMALVVKGHSSKEVAARLGISPRTVEVHRTHVMHKMAAGNLAELVSLHAFCGE